MHAVVANKLDTVLVLREFDGVDWNSKDLLGFSAIMIAVKYLRLEILEIVKLRSWSWSLPQTSL